jgi:hypothetical protein
MRAREQAIRCLGAGLGKAMIEIALLEARGGA